MAPEDRSRPALWTPDGPCRSALRASLAPPCVSGLVANSDDLAGCASEPRPSNTLLGIPAAAKRRCGDLSRGKVKGTALRAGRAARLRYTRDEEDSSDSASFASLRCYGLLMPAPLVIDIQGQQGQTEECRVARFGNERRALCTPNSLPRTFFICDFAVVCWHWRWEHARRIEHTEASRSSPKPRLPCLSVCVVWPKRGAPWATDQGVQLIAEN